MALGIAAALPAGRARALVGTTAMPAALARLAPAIPAGRAKALVGTVAAYVAEQLAAASFPRRDLRQPDNAPAPAG